jgi:hypothetical protein
MARGGGRFPATAAIVASPDIITTIVILTVANLHKIGIAVAWNHGTARGELSPTDPGWPAQNDVGSTGGTWRRVGRHVGRYVPQHSDHPVQLLWHHQVASSHRRAAGRVGECDPFRSTPRSLDGKASRRE